FSRDWSSDVCSSDLARKGAEVPHRFFYRKHKGKDSILLPRTSSGRREYLPCGFMNPNTIVSNQAFVIYDFEPYLFGVMSSKLHCIWMSITSGKMRNDYSYSVNLTYNTFPFPTISKPLKEGITQTTFRILNIREKKYENNIVQ